VLNCGRQKFAAAAWIGGLGSCLVISSARAASVEWHAPSGCGVDEFTMRVELVLGHALSEVKEHDFRVEVAEEAPDRWRLELALLTHAGEQGRRQIYGNSCADVTRAGAVAAAMALQAQETDTERPNAAASRDRLTASSPVPVAKAQGTHAEANASEPLAGPKPQDRATLRGIIALQLVGDMGIVGRPSLGPQLDLGLRWSPLWIGLSGTWLPEVEHEVAPGRGGEFELASAAAWACVRPEPSRWLLFACVHYEIGSLSGRGSGERVTESWSRSALWQALRPELGFALPLGTAFEAQARLGVAIALKRPEFVLDGELVALKPERLTARAAIGIAYTP
jgi:hypothetical protein